MPPRRTKTKNPPNHGIDKGAAEKDVNQPMDNGMYTYLIYGNKG
jgi:hypothetical protein